MDLDTEQQNTQETQQIVTKRERRNSTDKKESKNESKKVDNKSNKNDKIGTLCDVPEKSNKYNHGKHCALVCLFKLCTCDSN